MPSTPPTDSPPPANEFAPLRCPVCSNEVTREMMLDKKGRERQSCVSCRAAGKKLHPYHKVDITRPRKCKQCGASKKASEFPTPFARNCTECRDANKRDSGQKDNERWKRMAREVVNGTRDESTLPEKARERYLPKTEKRREEIRQGIPYNNESSRVKQEMARRALLRKSLLNFVNAFSTAPGGYKAGWVHKLICAKLEKFHKDIVEGKSPRLMFFLPPRSGKSEIVSKLFPAWYLGHHPDHEVIACSYAVSLPMDFSRKIKELIAKPEYKALFPRTTLDRNAQATEGWKTTRGGAYVASGVSGPITGKGAHCLVIDDPVKDAEEADSETIRNKVWSWYTSTAYTRLAPGGGLLLCQTRWHDDDLAGKIIANEKEVREELIAAGEEHRFDELDTWEVIEFPALADEDEWWDKKAGKIVHRAPENGIALRAKGDPLHPERFDRASLLRIKHTLRNNKRHWSALYQQKPAPDEGVHFTRSMLRYYDPAALFSTSGMLTYSAWDLAIGQKQENDWTVGLPGAWDWNGDLWLLDMVRGKMDTHEIVDAIITQAVKYGTLLTGIERGQLELAVRPTLDEQMRKRKTVIALAEGNEALVPILDKVARARPLQGLMQQGRVHFPLGAEWVDTVVAELLRFPYATNDDCVDALAWLARMVLRGATPPKPVDELYKAKPASWKDKLRGMGRGRDWRAA